MAAPDPSIVERQYYLSLLNLPDDPGYSLAELRAQTGGSASVATAVQVGTFPASAATLLRSAFSLDAFDSLKTSLAQDALDISTRSVGIQVLGDSTGNDPTDWVYLFTQALAAKYPNWTVQHRLWSDAAQDYAAPTTIQTGPLGERFQDNSTGTTTRRLDATVSPHLNGVIDVQIKANLASWNTGVSIPMCGKSGADGQRGWHCGVNNVGRPYFTYSTDGLAGTLATMTVVTTNPWGAGQTGWLRWVFTPNDGLGNRVLSAYSSPDGIVWTQIGVTVTTVGAVAVFNNAATGYEVGGVASGIGNATMKIYAIKIRNGLDGPSVVPALPDLWPPFNATGSLCVGSPILTVVNGSFPGAEIGYLGDATRLTKMMPDYGQAVAFLSDSHNEGLFNGAAWLARYETWLTSVQTRIVGIPVIILTQNPETAGTPWYREHAKRRLDLIAYAAKKAISIIDTYGEFIKYNNYAATYLADAVHPNVAGSTLWSNFVLKYFNNS